MLFKYWTNENAGCCLNASTVLNMSTWVCHIVCDHVKTKETESHTQKRDVICGVVWFCYSSQGSGVGVICGVVWFCNVAEAQVLNAM
jgi:hypothetical protein